MQNAKISQPIRKRVRVQRGRRTEITNLPFPAGSEIDVIITAAQARTSKKSVESIYDHTAAGPAVARRAVFDTDILISGYLWKGPPRQAIEKVRDKECNLLVSKETIAELIRVLAYRKFGLSPEEIQPIIEDLLIPVRRFLQL
jgi:hypothetical protein